MTQQVIVPTPVAPLVGEDRTALRPLQMFMMGVTANIVPLGGIVLWPAAATLPSGWQSVDTLVIGANTYKLLTQV